MPSPTDLSILCVTGIFPPDVGGPATYLQQICSALAARGHRITLVTLSDQSAPGPSGAPYRVIRLPRRLARPWRWARTIMVLVRLGRNADVLFVHGLALEAVLANAVIRRPLVHKVVGDLAWERATSLGWVDESLEVFQQRRHGFRVGMLKALRAWWTRRATRIIVPSVFLSQWVVGWGVLQERLVVIRNAVDLPEALAPVAVPLPPGVRLVVVGRLVPWKRVDGVLRAVAVLENTSLVIVGHGPEHRSLVTLAASLGMADRVLFAGQRAHHDTLALMASCDIFVLNSTYEGYPHVVLEAMGIGLPVIATAAGGTPELVRDGENGLLVAPDDEAGLRDAIARLAASPPTRRRLSEGARRSAAQHSHDALVEQTEAVLRDAARDLE